MIKSGAAILAMLGVLILTGCDDFKPGATQAQREQGRQQGQGPTTTTFSHRIDSDLSGYFTPVTPISVNGHRVKDLFLGQAADFAAWEGGSRPETQGPVMIEFEPVDGGDVIRVLPKSYSVADGRVRFEGEDARLGQVAFNGVLDADALATARRNLGSEAPVLSGTLRAGGTAFGHQSFRWYGGD